MDNERNYVAEADAAAKEFVLAGACFGIAIGWTLRAIADKDVFALAISAIAVIVFLWYRNYRISRSCGISLEEALDDTSRV